MQIQSFNESLEFNDTRVVTKVILETSFTKEIRILLKRGQIMKEHQTPFSILVHVLDGYIDFGVEGVIHHLKAGAIITLEGNVKHDLTAKEDSIVRLTLSKFDKVERVEQVVKNS
ncbi:cupin [Pedobacter alpinus]|uniref:Cupin n=1 Tax=Pedobacter alpinus TaxID=1590643 RepID=A0ABW5TSW2_9SPHI